MPHNMFRQIHIRTGSAMFYPRHTTSTIVNMITIIDGGAMS